jgi:hypothetical protein
MAARISVIVHAEPEPFAPVTADEIRDVLEAAGYDVKGVLVRVDLSPKGSA